MDELWEENLSLKDNLILTMRIYKIEIVRYPILVLATMSKKTNFGIFRVHNQNFHIISFIVNT